MIQQTILGINPGTRTMGVVIYSQGRISHAQVKTFRGPWNEKKQGYIYRYITKIIKNFDITHLACKRAHPSRSSQGLEIVEAVLVRIASENDLHLKWYTINELVCGYDNSDGNIKGLQRLLVEKFPELFREYSKELTNRHSYHKKLFIALAAADSFATSGKYALLKELQ